MVLCNTTNSIGQFCRCVQGLHARWWWLVDTRVASRLTPDDVVDLIMARQVTALVTAGEQGYDVTVHSEFVPMALVEASVQGKS